MADVWLPGAHIDRGRNAGYNSGRSSMERAVAHYTVGSDSRNVGRDGYFHFLVHRDASREGGCTQYAEVDAITWHAADAGNPYGPGVEWERNVVGGVNAEGLSDAEPLTPNQLEWGARLIDFFAEHGITPELYGGPRYGAGGWRGWVNHQAIDSSRSDGLLRWEWDAMNGGASVTDEPTPEEDIMYIAIGDALMGRVACTVDGGYRAGDFFTAPAAFAGIPADAIDWNDNSGRGLRYVYFDGDPDRFALLIQHRPDGL